MTRLMGDAIHVNVAALRAVPGLEVVAGYVTGTPDIQWTAADFAQFPGLPVVTIDQAANGSPVLSATVRDVQPGAWVAANAVNRNGWTADRPTIYSNQSDLTGVLQAGWQGDLWLAIVGWQAGDALPATPGCTVVAVQNQLDVANAYDLSVVLDPTWPEAEVNSDNQVPGVPGLWLTFDVQTDLAGNVFGYGRGTDGNFYVVKRVPGQPWGSPILQ